MPVSNAEQRRMDHLKGHTPTPWTTFLNDSQVAEMDGQGICAMWRVLPELSDEDNAEGRANARFIVRACNAHNDLVTALDLAHQHMRLYLTHYSENHNVFTDVTAALAKAKGD